ncbi:hypothetical protein ACFL67_00915 [candidate division KSB1 bacterium]
MNKLYRNIPAFLSILLLTVLFTGSGIAQEDGRITGFDNGRVRINWGTDQGIQEGIVLNVFREVPIYHPSTREKIGSKESVIGEIEIVESYKDNSVASITQTEKQFIVGDIVRISFVVSDKTSGEDQLEKGTITSLANNLVRFNMGAWDGVEENLLFDVFRYIGPSRHPVTGELVEQKNIYLGRVKVISVENTESTAQIIALEREILAGDRVVLSLQQMSDITMPPEDVEVQPMQQSETETQQPAVRTQESVSTPDNIVGRVTKVSGNDIYFIWRGEYGFPTGKVFGIFRDVELTHPESNVVIGRELIMLGQVRLIESINELGRGMLMSSDADVLPQDIVSLPAGETLQSGQVLSPANTEEVFQAQRSDILAEAQRLTTEVNQLQGEMSFVRTAISRLDRIDRELTEQKNITQSMNETLEEIKYLLTREGIPIESSVLSHSMASVDQMEYPGTDANLLRLKYSDDISVNVKLDNKTLFVSLETDTTLRSQLKASPEDFAVPQDTSSSASSEQIITGSGTELDTEAGVAEEGVEEEGGSFFTEMWFLITLAVILLGIAGALFFLLVIKKKKGGGAADTGGADEADEDDEGDDFESSDDDDFGDEEIIPDEEEIEAFEDD